VRVWSRTPANAKKFADEIQAQCCTTVKEAVAGADVIVTATFAENYVLEGKWVKQGAVINGVYMPLNAVLINYNITIVVTNAGVIIQQCAGM